MKHERRLGFARTTCACPECVACCHRQAGSLAPGEFEQIAAYLGEPAKTATRHFWASPGALVGRKPEGVAGRVEVFRVGTITPRMVDGRCTFLTTENQCGIWPVAPFGCAMFSACTMTKEEGMERGVALVKAQMGAAYQALRDTLPQATSYQPKGY